MDRTMCPGQDTRYWRPGDIFNVPCASCGAPVEFFKDDTARRCSRCGTRVRNPRLSTGCAQWCAHAKECLGYDPNQAGKSDAASTQSVAGALLEALKKETVDSEYVLAAALAALKKAQDLIMEEPADPGVVIPAVLLLHAGCCGDGETAYAERIMKDAGVEHDAIEDASAIIRAIRSGTAIDSPEFRTVAASYPAQGGRPS